MPRLLLLVVLATTCLSLTACSKPITGPIFKKQLASGQPYFGEIFSPVAFSSAAPLKVMTSEANGYFLVSALDGHFYSYDLDTGKRLDKKPFARLPKGVRATPYLDASQKHLVVGCYDRKVHALDILSGAPHWSTELDGYIQAPVVASGSTLVVGTLSGTVYGLSPIDGSILWQIALGGEIFGQAGVSPNWRHRALVGNSKGKLVIIDTSSGAELGTFEVPGGLHAGPAVVAAEGAAAAFFGTEEGMLYARQLPGEGETGAGSALWEAKLGDKGVWATPAIAPTQTGASTLEEAVVYAVSNASAVAAFEAATGTELWTTDLAPADRLHATPLVTETHLYVGSLNHYLYALDRTDGSIAWSFESFGDFRAPVILDNDRIIAVSNDHFLYALAWDTGQPLVGDLTPPPAPAVVDLTLGLTGGAEALEISPGTADRLQQELAPEVAIVFQALRDVDLATITSYLAEADPNRRSIMASAVVQRFAEFTLQQQELSTVIPATAGDAVAVVNVQATRGETPVRMVLTLRFLKDATQTPAWRIEPGSLKPENVIEVPVLRSK